MNYIVAFFIMTIILKNLSFSLPQVVRLILQGILLFPPDLCPSDMRSLMRSCWSTDPQHRLNFDSIINRLQEIKKKTPIPKDDIDETNRLTIKNEVFSSQTIINNEKNSKNVEIKLKNESVENFPKGIHENSLQGKSSKDSSKSPIVYSIVYHHSEEKNENNSNENLSEICLDKNNVNEIICDS